MSMGDEAVIAAIKQLVLAGEYRDELFGLPGEALDDASQVFYARGASAGQRVFARGSEEHLAARGRGLVQRLPPLTPAPLTAVTEAEDLIGAPLPSLLRRLYLEIGNGGFGPGHGVLGLAGGFPDDTKKTATDMYRQRDFPESLLAICSWGCAIYSLVEPAAEGRMWGYDPNPVELPEQALFPQAIDINEWFSRWLEGRLMQPWAVQDPATGEWRGATDEEDRLAAMEAEG